MLQRHIKKPTLIKTHSAKDNIIGQFGVGFYAGFMVGDHITVCSKSYDPEQSANVWQSTGHGSYDIAPAKHATRGTKIVIKVCLRQQANAVGMFVLSLPSSTQFPLPFFFCFHCPHLP